MLARLGLAGDEAAGAHGEDVPVPDRHLPRQPTGHRDRAAELLGDLADQGVLGALPRLDLPSGELPAARGLGRPRPSCGQQPTVADDRCSDDDGHPLDATAS